MTWWWQPPCLRRLVIVNCLAPAPGIEATVIRGILWEARAQWLVLKNAEALALNQPPKPLDGEIVIPRANVDFLQVYPV
jgi:hypothetical protein